jgi:Mrp family chromosome partitioning ATPase
MTGWRLGYAAAPESMIQGMVRVHQYVNTCASSFVQEAGITALREAEPDVQIEDIIIPSGEHANLDLLPCGVIPPNPSELLQTSRLDELFIALRERYDYVIVDTAPVALVSDTYLLDRIADMTIFVCRYKYTPAEMVNYVNSVVEQKRMKNVACVLNAVKGSQAGYGYGYGYGVKGK